MKKPRRYQLYPWMPWVDMLVVSFVMPLAIALPIVAFWLLIEQRPQASEFSPALCVASISIWVPLVMVSALLEARIRPGMFGTLIRVLPPNGTYFRTRDQIRRSHARRRNP